MATTMTYPVRVEARLDESLSRWLWLVKWLLVIPHYFLLAFLWLAFFVVSVVAFFAILFTARYPASLFEFNIGVMRWSWRVNYYAYGALGTDRYPPFTLADVPDYPARLHVAYPERLSRGLVLVKWWLLAIPHYLIVGFFVGGGAWLARQSSDWQWSWGGGGLVGILVLVSAIILAITGSYPQPLFDFILGMNRWVWRVVGYAGLMTDQYPPFRLDLGGAEPAVALPAGVPAGTLDGGAPSSTADRPADTPVDAPVAGAETQQPSRPGSAWTAGRTVSVIVGAILALTAVGLIIGGVATLSADRAARDSGGYVTSSTAQFSTTTRALTTDNVNMAGRGPGWAYPRSILGEVRLRFTASDPTRETFVGAGPTSAVNSYLSGVDYATVTNFSSEGVTYIRHAGTAPTTPPGQATFWAAKASGPGTQTLAWIPSAGDWTVVVMNPDGSPGVSVRADVGATVPALTWVAVALIVVGVLLLALAAVLIIIPVSRASTNATT